MTQKDYYDILGVPKNATAEQIKKSFKKKAAAMHPDNLDTGDESGFKELVAAYEVLSDAQKKEIYDRYGHEGLKGSARGGGGQDFDMGSFVDLADIFEHFFGGGGGRGGSRRRGGTERGADLKFDLQLDFLEAVHGVEQKITIEQLEDCAECKGSGAAPGANPITCKTCAGHGQVRQSTSTFFGTFTQVAMCSDCNGEGNKIDRPCLECSGKGQVRNPRTIELKVPGGVDTGSRLRVTAGGDKGRKGAPPGDLYVVIHVRDHDTFIRDGMTVHIKQPISFSMAGLGGEVLAATVDGNRVVKVPAGTQTGSTIVLKDMGVPSLSNPNRRGEQIIHLIVETPKKLSDKEKQLLKELAELRGESLSVPAEVKKESSGKGGQSFFESIADVFKSNKNSASEP